MTEIAVLKERTPGEKRVAIDPPTAAKLAALGWRVNVEAGAGEAAGFPDKTYTQANAQVAIVADRSALLKNAEVVVWVQPPEAALIAEMKPGSVALGLVFPHRHPELIAALQAQRIAMLALEAVPRITRAQAMDVLSSQATVAGYQAALLAADLSPRLFPMLTTAAGTLRPAKVVVIGAGVAGLQAIATARRLGAQVEAYDIRAAAREQVESLGARMIDTGVNAEGEGGYARELSSEEKGKQAAALARHLAKADAVIATAALPGRPAPKIISREMVEGMQPGAVIVDLAAESGGNCELTVPGENVIHQHVTIAGPLDLPSRAALHASEMFARNVANLLALLRTADGKLSVDTGDEVILGCLLTHDGRVVHRSLAG